jgi:trans-aconitate 2-methyltransferase
MKFSGPRMRPAMDLITRAAGATDPALVKSVLDLGCGPGNLTSSLLDKFPNARVLGVDSSVEMVGEAVNRRESKGDAYKERVEYRVGTIEAEAGLEVGAGDSSKHDVIFSNAALHWVPDHDTLLPALLSRLHSNGGLLALQMPDTISQPSHQLMETAAFRSGALETLRNVRIPRVEKSALWYYTLLSPLTRDVEIWTTEYAQLLPTEAPNYADSHEHRRHPVLEYTRSAGLTPILEALGGEESVRCQAYLHEYDRLLREAYKPILVHNKYVSNRHYTMFPYKRFFLLAKL